MAFCHSEKRVEPVRRGEESVFSDHHFNRLSFRNVRPFVRESFTRHVALYLKRFNGWHGSLFSPVLSSISRWKTEKIFTASPNGQGHLNVIRSIELQYRLLTSDLKTVKGGNMNTTTQIVERRQNPRFKVQGMVIAVTQPPSLPPGPIKEVSQTGLTFHYRQNGNNQNGNKWMTPQSLDIIWADYVATHHLKNLPVRTVSDVLIEPEKKSNESATRQLAVAFENLTLDQQNQINRLIKERGAAKIYMENFIKTAQSIIETNHV